MNHITVTLIGGPAECDGARFQIPSGVRHFRVPYTPGRRCEAGPDGTEVISQVLPLPDYRAKAHEVAVYGLEQIRFDYSIQFVGVHVDTKIGEAGKRLIEFYGRALK